MSVKSDDSGGELLPGHRVPIYYYDPVVGSFHYGQRHPMKPHRIHITHSLVLSYNLNKHMHFYRPKLATKWDLCTFHAQDYIDFLSRVTNDNMSQFSAELKKFSVGSPNGDSPVFGGMYEFCQRFCGGSLNAAQHMNQGLSDVTINWAGGLHHAKKAEASGFCYVNDICVAILELLKHHPRVMYLDIDVHHGDGVQEAFYLSDRVMTVSFHKYGRDFFPGTGDMYEIGEQQGKYYSVNVPLRDGINDETYHDVYKPIMDGIIKYYRPTALVMQCGADSLGMDRLGVFNLSISGHGEAVNHMKSYGLPIMYLGGGGYTLRNVARCWTYETSIIAGRKIANELPYNDYHGFFNPDYVLQPQIAANKADNLNKKEYIEFIKESTLTNLKRLPHAPSVQMHDTPGDLFYYDDFVEVEDERIDESGVNIGPGGIERKPHYHEHYDSKHDLENTDGMRRHKTIGENYNDHLKSC